MQATPLFKDRRNFTLMADPLMDGNYPVKSLHQALAVAAMCLQEEASARPLMSDVVTALEYLTKSDELEEEKNRLLVDRNGVSSSRHSDGHVEKY